MKTRIIILPCLVLLATLTQISEGGKLRYKGEGKPSFEPFDPKYVPSFGDCTLCLERWNNYRVNLTANQTSCDRVRVRSPDDDIIVIIDDYLLEVVTTPMTTTTTERTTPAPKIECPNYPLRNYDYCSYCTKSGSIYRLNLKTNDMSCQHHTLTSEMSSHPDFIFVDTPDKCDVFLPLHLKTTATTSPMTSTKIMASIFSDKFVDEEGSNSSSLSTDNLCSFHPFTLFLIVQGMLLFLIVIIIGVLCWRSKTQTSCICSSGLF